MNVQDDLQRAREHIQAKRYSKARRILKRLNDPTAIKWLAKLDEIAPETTHLARSETLLMTLGVLLVIIVGIVVGTILTRTEQYHR